jgi:hypothetical protein
MKSKLIYRSSLRIYLITRNGKKECTILGHRVNKTKVNRTRENMLLLEKDVHVHATRNEETTDTTRKYENLI